MAIEQKITEMARKAQDASHDLSILSTAAKDRVLADVAGPRREQGVGDPAQVRIGHEHDHLTLARARARPE